MSTIIKEEKCPICNETKKMTTDHIIPRWLTKRLDLFAIDIIIVGNTQKICAECNYDKGGVLDYNNKTVKKFVREFIKELRNKVK